MILLPISPKRNSPLASRLVILLVMASVLGTVACGAPAAGSRISVHLKAQVRTAQPFLSVGDVAGVACSDENLARAAARVFLGLAPEPKERRTIERAEIHDRLVSSGFMTDEILLEGAHRVVVIGVPPTVRSFLSTAGAPPWQSSATSSSQRPSEGSLRGSSQKQLHRDVVKETRVRIHKKHRVLAVEEAGLALESGNVGDTIRVKCLRIGNEESLRVIGPGTVGSRPTAAEREERQRHVRVSKP